MSALDRKLWRDLRRMWAQALAIAMVMAAGVATLLLAVGAYRSLEETRSAYYDRYRFADVFASATRAPEALKQRMLEIPGVAAVETRIVKSALLDIEGMAEPATGFAISLPDHRRLQLNRLYLRAGRLPEPGRAEEVTVNEAFAKAHGFRLGDRFKAILNGRKRTLTIVGIALSPEFIYALGPGDIVPDGRRFAVMWMSEKALESIFDLDGAFNSVGVKLLRDASESEIVKRIDDILEGFGGTGAFGRKDQQSHAFIDSELEQLRAMSRVMPPIFLLVSAFLINMTLSRLIALEREQIGLLKAVGYGRIPIAVHYLKIVLAIAGCGLVIGFVAGTWLGHGLTRLYADFFNFPFLIFRRDLEIYLIAAVVSAGAAVAGGVKAVHSAVALPPAVAMAPPAPTQYAQFGIERFALLRFYSQLTMMALRHIIRWPLRSGLTTLGLALSVSLLITSLFMLDSLEVMIDVTFFQSDRQDATIDLVDEKGSRVVQAVAQLPGVLRAEPYRQVAARLRNGHLDRRLAIVGKPHVGHQLAIYGTSPDTALSRVLGLDLKPIVLPETGLTVSERVAEILNIRRGQTVEVEILEGRRGTKRVPVTDIIQSYFGLAVYMDLGALNEMLDESPQVTGVHISYDGAQAASLFDAIKGLPAVSAISLQRVALAKFRETIGENINIMTTVYVALSVIIAFGVVYNSARIQLSERARELASLRVLGFTRTEVSRVLLVELAVLTLLAIPLGWIIGYGFARLVLLGFDSDLYSIPFAIELDTYAVASLVVLAAAALSALIVRQRIDRLDMIRALKTRE
ncbi:MAG: ABC transporter permease [Hyphomicrobiales bacterium]|nr:ABC transporter permease [Hyphomicrobiales bacterium]